MLQKVYKSYLYYHYIICADLNHQCSKGGYKRKEEGGGRRGGGGGGGGGKGEEEEGKMIRKTK